MRVDQPYLATNSWSVDTAFRIAVGDLLGNVRPYRAGLLREPAHAIMAGLDYNSPWTRDTAINVWNGSSLIIPEVARNTLLSVLTDEDGPVRVGGQYWDAIIWVTGAWHHYLCTGDRGFLALALEVSCNSLRFFADTEYNPATGLFNGPACYGDGVAAYPDVYANTESASSCILEWPGANPDTRASRGYGIPMHALSTNCLYWNAYATAREMALELGQEPDRRFAEAQEALGKALDKAFWLPAGGHYRYLADHLGQCDHQEGLGHAFAILFGLATPEQAARILDTQHTTPAGVPCVWPTFGRYRPAGSDGYGRHSGTVWPHVQGFWAEAAARHGRGDAFAHEFLALTEHANRDGHFAEIYHPDTAKPYGGLQEDGADGIRLWRSCRRQTWSATAYIRMVLAGVLGMRFSRDGIRFAPCVPEGLAPLRITGLRYREALLEVRLGGKAGRETSLSQHVPADAAGTVVVSIGTTGEERWQED